MSRALRNATAHGAPSQRTGASPDPTPSAPSWEAYRGVGDPRQRYSLWRLCPCPECDGTGKDPQPGRILGPSRRCQHCRGEGRVKQLIATCGTAEAVGVTIVTLGLEGEWDDCPIGLLDNEGDTGRKWIVRPWERSPRNVSDAGKLLRRERDIKTTSVRSPW